MLQSLAHSQNRAAPGGSASQEAQNRGKGSYIFLTSKRFLTIFSCEWTHENIRQLQVFRLLLCAYKIIP